ncbi:MAG: L-serine ammonia-lyase [Chitinophagales bacterium]
MIRTSFFELFKIGPGPSSSHTVAPMKAAARFREHAIEIMQQKPSTAYRIRVELYGALAATGHGHGTDRAIVAGLYGEKPKTVDIKRLNRVFTVKGEVFNIPFPDFKLPFVEEDIFFQYENNPYWHPNTMRFILMLNYEEVMDEIYYSIGGGFIQQEGVVQASKTKRNPKFSYKNLNELVVIQKSEKIDLGDLLIQNEMALTGKSEAEIYEGISEIMQVMNDSVHRGLHKEGILAGGLNVHRRAKAMYAKALAMDKKKRYADALMARMNAYALATSEENAAGELVVTAPTNGAAGVIPACLAYLKDDCQISHRELQRGLLVAAMIGFVIKENASISGAALGCMAEVGSASAMAAALFAYVLEDGNIELISTAAEIAMEHHLGMTCDPIKGLVQIPCIERNANGAIKAYNAYLLASGRTEKGVISFDQVVEVMRQTGEDLSSKYKETAKGGLATAYGWGNMPGS